MKQLQLRASQCEGHFRREQLRGTGTPHRFFRTSGKGVCRRIGLWTFGS